MAQRSLASAMDLYLGSIKTGDVEIGPANKMVACSAEPSSYTEANATFALASVAMASGDFTVATGDGGGNVARKVTVAAKSSVPVVVGGTVTHVALLDTVHELLMYVTTCSSEIVEAGGTVNFPSWKIEVGAPSTESDLPVSGLAVPTFHCMSLYYNRSTAPTSSSLPWSGPKVWVRFRREDVATWTEGFPLTYDARTSGNALPYAYNCRGSVVNLQPGTNYVFEFGIGTSYAAATWVNSVTGTTWSETFPETGSTVTIPSGTGMYTISSGGSEALGYRVYDGWNGTSKNQRESGATGSAIVVDANYVIVRRTAVTKAYWNAIEIKRGRHHVVIEDCDLTDWDWAPRSMTAGGYMGGANEVGAVGIGWYGPGGVANGNCSQIVVQRCKIYDPHFGSFPWDEGHPDGPSGIYGNGMGPQNVIRYNDIYSTNTQKWFKDGIGGADNFSATGFPGADSDIYGNHVANVFDDAIEAEGGGRNVRVWGNYINHTAIGVAETIAHFGPIYIWRNVMNRMRFLYTPSPDNDIERGPMFKNYGTAGGYGGGMKFFFHNTALQTPGSEFSPSQTRPLGAGFGNLADNPSQPMANTVSRNNIYHIWRTDRASIHATGGTGVISFANDMYNGNVNGTTVTNGIPDVPTYISGHGWPSVPSLSGNGTGNYQLAVGSPGLNAGVVIPNFNDASSSQPFAGAAPDVGAHEAGAPAMKFGVTP